MWDIKVNFDSDNDDIAIVNATWTEAAGSFSYSMRRSKGVGAVNSIVATAIGQRNEWQRKNGLNSNAAASILTKINAADPQGVK